MLFKNRPRVSAKTPRSRSKSHVRKSIPVPERSRVAADEESAPMCLKHVLAVRMKLKRTRNGKRVFACPFPGCGCTAPAPEASGSTNSANQSQSSERRV